MSIQLPGEVEIDSRLETVLATLYLLFSEGYYSESKEGIVREELCIEAMRLTNMLIENERTNKTTVNALLSLMCFHSSRFKARKDEKGEIILYHDQDEKRWNYGLISKGIYFLKQASQGNTISKYHLEASIAYSFWPMSIPITVNYWLVRTKFTTPILARRLVSTIAHSVRKCLLNIRNLPVYKTQ